ncbi:MAG TPA: hypothetical protein VD866_28645, partial [Urbifossiella sp.]|nr:hypothetical protein [Urbifossiella sp.]
MPRRPALRPRLEPLEDRTTPTAGDLDPTFGTGGRAFPDLGGFGALYGVATLADGNILVAGETNGFLESDIAVARLTPTGQLDPTFGTGGVYTLDLGGFEYAGGLFPRPDGSVLVSAYSDTPGGAIVVVRLTAGGQPDPTFGAGGLVRAGFGGSFESGGVAGVLADGRIVLAGRSDFDFAAARLTAAGQPDPTFGVGGAVVDTAGPDRDSRAFVLQPDGKVVVVGYTQSGPNPQVAAIRFTSAGQLDPGFGTGGRVQIDFGSFVVPEGVVVQPDGSLVLGGFNDAPGVRDFAALRLTSAGQLDTTFGTAGLAVVDFGFEDSARDVALQPDGAIVLTGSVNTAPVFSFAAARLTPAGQPDPTFGTNGHVFHPYSDFDQAGGGGLQPDGKVLVLGSHLEPGIGSYPMIVRLTTDPAPNTPPSTSDVANQTVPAGGSTGALPVTVSDAETAAASLNLTATSSNPALVPAGAIVLGGSGASRTVTVTPAAGQFGSATITLTVTDGGAMTATDTFTVTVPPPPPNTPPSISDVPNLTVPAGGNTGALPFTVSDAQTAAATLTVTAASSNLALVPMAAIAFGGSGASRTVTVTPAAGQYGTATISVTVTDGGGLTAVDAFTIDVPLPPPPPLPA